MKKMYFNDVVSDVLGLFPTKCILCVLLTFTLLGLNSVAFALALGQFGSAADDGRENWWEPTTNTAVGPSAAATGTNSTAFGTNTSASADNSVALGRGSVADQDNTVSVGSPDNERRITNVASGVNSTDAVNKGQLDKTNAGVAQNSSDINQNRSDINHNRSDINQNSEDISSLGNSLSDLKTESRAGIAAAAALVELTPSGPGKTTLNLGSATFKGEVAVGITAVHRLAGIENMMLNTGISFSDDAVLARVGMSWEF